MKTLQNILFFSFLFLIISCSDTNDRALANVRIDGMWKLKYVNGSFSGASYTFEPGVVNWTFDPTTQKVTVENNNTNDNLNAVFESGIYDYEIITTSSSSCGETIVINNMEMGCLTLTNSILLIKQTFPDGIQIQLVR